MENEPLAPSPQSKSDELEERLIEFAVRIIRLSASLPKTPAGKLWGRSCGREPRARQIMARPEARKATPILCINWALS